MSKDFSGISGGRDGRVTVVFGALLLVGGILIVVKQGRIWVGITGLVLLVALGYSIVATCMRRLRQ